MFVNVTKQTTLRRNIRAVNNARAYVRSIVRWLAYGSGFAPESRVYF